MTDDLRAQILDMIAEAEARQRVTRGTADWMAVAGRLAALSDVLSLLDDGST